MLQPRHPTGAFASNGDTPHEKARYHAGQAHLARVAANIARHSGDMEAAATHDDLAKAHQEKADKHQAEALKS